MVAILASIFFTRLEAWYSEIQVASRLWGIADKNKIESLDEHRKKALSLQSSRPIYGFYLVASFILLITILGGILGMGGPNIELSIPFIFLPGASFDVLFFAGSGILLINGEKNIDKLVIEINKALGIS